jgi:hypothetical protein
MHFGGKVQYHKTLIVSERHVLNFSTQTGLLSFYVFTQHDLSVFLPNNISFLKHLGASYPPQRNQPPDLGPSFYPPSPQKTASGSWPQLLNVLFFILYESSNNNIKKRREKLAELTALHGS